MGEVQQFVNINPGEVLMHATDYFSQGYRLVQIGCTQTGELFEMNYTFDKGYSLVNLRFMVAADYEIPSISPVCFSAFLYENEIHDLYGLTIKNMVIDYKGSFYRVRGNAPFRKNVQQNNPEGE